MTGGRYLVRRLFRGEIACRVVLGAICHPGFIELARSLLVAPAGAAPAVIESPLGDDKAPGNCRLPTVTGSIKG